MMDDRTEEAQAIIRILDRRKGFDYFWGDIPEEIKEEIVGEIQAYLDSR